MAERRQVEDDRDGERWRRRGGGGRGERKAAAAQAERTHKRDRRGRSAIKQIDAFDGEADSVVATSLTNFLVK